jgi:alcohol dehydrogenase, propanol-preferring
MSTFMRGSWPMGAKMAAYRVVAWGHPPEVVEVDVPVPAPGQLVVRVAGNGLCHSDLMMSQIPGDIGEAIGWRVPFTLGHEIAGWVDTLGDGVTSVAVGDAVALVSPHSCGSCAYCIRGHDSVCPEGLAGRGYGRDGGLAAYVLVDSVRDVLLLGSLDPVVAGPLTDAGATSYHAVTRVLPKLRPGSTAVVIGAGGLGAYAVQLLRALSPATVVAVDTNPARLEFARELGAHETAAEVSGAQVADVVLDFVGVDATIAAGLTAVRPAGAFALVGASGGTFARPWFGGLPRDADVFTFQGSNIADARDVIALAEAGLVRSEVDRFPFERVADAYAALDQGRLRGRAVVEPR